ncbi:MAG: TolC family protein [Phycisphaeraceae bacterium]
MHRRRCHALAAAALLLTLALTGCRSYQAQPLDLPAYQNEWKQRDLTSPSVAAFAEQLATRHEDDDADPPPAFDPDDGLTLDEAEAVTLLLNPHLRTLRLRAQVPLMGARNAGQWQDPSISFNALRILESVQDPWILGGGLALTLPLSGRLAVERDLAWSEYDAAWREAALAEWETLNELRQAWLRWSATQQEAALLREYLAHLEPVQESAERLVEVGELPATDARVLQMETARRAVELTHLQAQADQQRIAVLRLLGLSPAASVDLVASLNLPAPNMDADAAQAAILEHPELILAQARYDAAEHRLHREIRKQYPDLTIGPATQWEEGQSRIGLSGALPIPLWNRNSRAIEEAESARDAARAETHALLQSLTHRLDTLHRQQQSGHARRRTLEEDVAPLVDQQMQEMQQLIELGELNILLLYDALQRSLQTKQAMLQATREQASASAAIRAMLQPRWAIEPAQDASKERK